MKIYNIILRGIDQLDFPRHVTKTAIAIIKKFCKEAPSERLGYQKDGILDIRKHRWDRGGKETRYTHSSLNYWVFKDTGLRDFPAPSFHWPAIKVCFSSTSISSQVVPGLWLGRPRQENSCAADSTKGKPFLEMCLTWERNTRDSNLHFTIKII